MTYNMVVDSELVGLSIPEKFLAYSDAYCSAAIALTSQMASDPEKAAWAKAAVVLMLSAHSAELLLKGMLFHKDQNFKINNTHDLEKLYGMYQREFPESKYHFDMPFKTECQGMSEAEVEIFKKEQRPPAPSVLYRYPTKTGSAEWEGAFGFEASSYMRVVHALSKDIARLRECIT
ncbi:hypothetical protein [Methylobacter sp. sgz302048]|uniref:hypothetical protein n=1 Tax=Methylobacter sp. sgz302048 TaxID=3455945 RepID=UPI003FA0D17A